MRPPREHFSRPQRAAEARRASGAGTPRHGEAPTSGWRWQTARHVVEARTRLATIETSEPVLPPLSGCPAGSMTGVQERLREKDKIVKNREKPP
jgi:hypothetical protein